MAMELDPIFLQECLSELRDGERVTIQVHPSLREKVLGALVEMGATRRELERLTVE